MELSWISHDLLSNFFMVPLEKIIDPFKPRNLKAAEKKLYDAIKRSISKPEAALLKAIRTTIDGYNFKTFSDSEIEKLLNKINKHIRKFSKPITKASIPPIIFHRKAFYKLVKGFLSNKLGINPVFNLEDTKALKRLGKFDDWWVGKHYRDGVTQQVSGLLKKIPKEVPLARDPLGKYLDKNVTKIVKSEAYWKMYSANALNRARSYSSMRTFFENEIFEYEVSAVLDQRTSVTCETMDGTVMSTEKAIKKWEEIDDVTNPDEIKEIWKWGLEDKQGAYVKNPDGTKEYLRGLTGDDLQVLGLDAPPYHGSCRTGIIPLF